MIEKQFEKKLKGGIQLDICLILALAWLGILFILWKFIFVADFQPIAEVSCRAQTVLTEIIDRKTPVLYWALLCLYSFISISDILEYRIPNACILAGIGIFLLSCLKDAAAIFMPAYQDALPNIIHIAPIVHSMKFAPSSSTPSMVFRPGSITYSMVLRPGSITSSMIFRPRSITSSMAFGPGFIAPTMIFGSASIVPSLTFEPNFITPCIISYANFVNPSMVFGPVSFISSLISERGSVNLSFGKYFLQVFRRIMVSVFLAGGVAGISHLLGKMHHISRQKILGGGDIKLILLAGLFLGLERGLQMLLLACALGTVLGLLQILIRHKHSFFPFGPAIAFAFLIVLFSNQIP